MESEQRQHLYRKLRYFEHHRALQKGLLGWWRQWATRPHGAPFIPMGELSLLAEEVAGDNDEAAFLVCAHALAMATWPGSRTPFVGGAPSGLGGAMASAVTARKWSKEVAESHLFRILGSPAEPVPVLEAVTQTVRSLWNQGVAVDLGATAATAHLMLAADPGQAKRGRIEFAKDFGRSVYTSALPSGR